MRAFCSVKVSFYIRLVIVDHWTVVKIVCQTTVARRVFRKRFDVNFFPMWAYLRINYTILYCFYIENIWRLQSMHSNGRDTDPSTYFAKYTFIM